MRLVWKRRNCCRRHPKIPQARTTLSTTTPSLNLIRVDAQRQQGGDVGAASQIAHVSTGLDYKVFGLQQKTVVLRGRRGGRSLVLGEIRTE